MKKLFVLTLAIALCALVFPYLLASAQEQDRPGLDQAARQERDLAKVFRKHERLKMNTSVVADQVRRSKQLSIYTSSVAFDLELELHDMRGRNYRAVEVGPDGVERPVKMGPVRTYKGKVLGRTDAQARFTIDDTTLEGVVITPEERYLVEPVRKYSAAATADDFVLYRASDVIEGQNGVEGPIDFELRHTVDGVAPKVNEALALQANDALALAPEAVTTVRDVELATETDAEYVTALGGSAAANAEIQSIMNMVEGVYQQQLDLSFTIVFQHNWTSASTDPYSRTAPGGCYSTTICGPNATLVSKGIINEFTEYWNANFPPGSPSANNPRRDLAHMWTGKDVDSSTIGLAWIDVVCSAPTYSYGFSQRITSSDLVKYAVTAHEIGHNFGADHSNGQTGCTNTIMESSSSSNTVLNFCAFSVSQIKTYTDANAGCLSAAPSCTFTISPTSKSFTSTGGPGSVSVTTATGCAWRAVSNVAWITITAGASGTGNATVNYTVAANAGGARSGTLTIAGKTFTVSQSAPAAAALPALSSLRLNISTIAGCKSVTGTVTLTAVAPINGVVVTLSDNIAAANTPASVTVPSGAKTKSFTITTVPVTSNQVGSVTAKLGLVTKSASLTVRRVGVQAVSLSPNPVVGPNPVTGTVILECKTPTNLLVTISSSNTAVAVPASSVTVLAGASSKTFSIRTANVSVSSSAIITATANAISKTRTLTVN